MKKFTCGSTIRSSVTQEMDMIFLETLFMEYAHRTYNHFYSMYPILITKIQKDVITGEILANLAHESTQKLLPQAKKNHEIP